MTTTSGASPSSTVRGIIDAAAVRVAASKAQTLVEALPWLERFRGALVVVKYGGNAMVDDTLKRAFAQDVAFLRYAGLRPVVVHGGGPQIAQMLGRLGLTSEFRNGLRVTTPEVMEVVRMVLTGQVGRELVGLLNQHGPLAVGLSGEDAGLLGARRRAGVYDDGSRLRPRPGRRRREREPVRRHGHPRRRPDPRRLHRRPGPRRRRARSSTSTPTPPRPHSPSRCTPTSSSCSPTSTGIYASWPDPDSLLSYLTVMDAQDLLGKVDSGMVPKLEACIRAVQQGVPQAHVIDGRKPHSLLLEVFTDEGIGTMVVPDPQGVVRA